jgi:enterochelin esterase-like enzyme
MDVRVIAVAFALASVSGLAAAQTAAPLAAPAAEARLQVVSIESAQLKAPRSLTVYLPPGWAPGRTYPVVYMADGQAAAAVIRALDPMVRDGRLPPILLVGLHAAPDGTQRHREYLPRFDGPGERAFSRHLRFFLDEVIPLAEQRYGASASPQDRLLLGFSDGASWAVSTALREPRRFAKVAAFSIGWTDLGLESSAGPRPTFWLGAGTDEGVFKLQTETFASEARSKGYDVRLTKRPGVHGQALWSAMYPDALRWAFAS